MAAQGGGLIIDYHEGNYNGETVLDSLVRRSKKGLRSKEHHELIDGEYLSVLKEK